MVRMWATRPTSHHRPMTTKKWQVVLGLGAACAVCCAAPIAAGVAALFAGGAGAWLAYAGGVVPLVLVAVGVLTGLAIWQWRRRARRAASACGCAPALPSSPSKVDSKETRHANL
jgi:membrane protein YdbS with pleckstrin-like domain